MTEPNDQDPIQMLRHANPASAESVPSASLARVRARVQEMVMTEPQPAADRGQPIRRRYAVGVLGATAIAAALFFFGPRAGAPGVAPGPSEAGGGGTAMCIRFDLELLAQQEVAFDGTVTAIDGESVTFAVGSWYRGSGEASVTLTEVGLGGGVSLEGTTVPFAVGQRYLVSGTGGIVTGCGFSQAYDAAAAADWASAFGS